MSTLELIDDLLQTIMETPRVIGVSYIDYEEAEVSSRVSNAFETYISHDEKDRVYHEIITAWNSLQKCGMEIDELACHCRKLRVVVSHVDPGYLVTFSLSNSLEHTTD